MIEKHIQNFTGKIQEYYKTHKERTLILIALFVTSLTFLWIFEKPTEAPHGISEPSEMGVNIPKGFLVVPLELANNHTISMMINRMGVVDVFSGSSRLIVRNLRVLKLNNEENPAFGALVPEKQAAELQGIFAGKNLRAALKGMTSESAQFFIKTSSAPKIEIYTVQE